MEAELNPLCVQGLNPYHKTNALEKEKKKLEKRERVHFFVFSKCFRLDSKGKSKDDWKRKKGNTKTSYNGKGVHYLWGSEAMPHSLLRLLKRRVMVRRRRRIIGVGVPRNNEVALCAFRHSICKSNPFPRLQGANEGLDSVLLRGALPPEVAFLVADRTDPFLPSFSNTHLQAFHRGNVWLVGISTFSLALRGWSRT